MNFLILSNFSMICRFYFLVFSSFSTYNDYNIKKLKRGNFIL